MQRSVANQYMSDGLSSVAPRLGVRYDIINRQASRTLSCLKENCFCQVMRRTIKLLSRVKEEPEEKRLRRAYKAWLSTIALCRLGIMAMKPQSRFISQHVSYSLLRCPLTSDATFRCSPTTHFSLLQRLQFTPYCLIRQSPTHQRGLLLSLLSVVQHPLPSPARRPPRVA